MKLEGDPEGLEALKVIREQRPDYLKFLVSEARSSTTRSAPFKASDGTEYVLRFVPSSGNLAVERPKNK